MVDLTTRNADSLFNFVVICESDTELIKFLFPKPIRPELVNRIIEFALGCCKSSRCCEFFVLLFTDNSGRSEYAHCLQTLDDIFICFTSHLPWFDCFHRLLEEIKSKDFYKSELFPTLKQFVTKLKAIEPPSAGKNAISIPYPIPQVLDADIRLPIPTSTHPYFLKAFECYYSSLEPLQWIDIFTSMLLEKSILFFSKSRQRLTYCIIAAVSLLYPLSWVSPIYPVLSRRLLQFLESPVPFIAGIHSCMLEEAKPYITYRTRVVDLDDHRIMVNMPDEELDSEDIPTPILDFFGVEFSNRNRFLKLAMTKKSQEFASWKISQLPMQNYLAQQAKPFFSILVNLLGYFRECRNLSGQVDFQRMVACQACPPLEPFLLQLYESQMVHCFLDERLASHTVDDFDTQARLLSDECKRRLQEGGHTKPNFGDRRWIECKRSITTNGIINSLRFRRKIGQKWTKFATKASMRTPRPKSEKSSPRLAEEEGANGVTPTPTPTPSITHSLSASAVDSTASRTRTAWSTRSQRVSRTPVSAMATSFSERLPSPVEYLRVGRGVPLEGPISESPITPTTVLPRPPVPPKNFVLIPRSKEKCGPPSTRNTGPPPVPRRSFRKPPQPASFSSGRFKPTSPENNTNTVPPVLPPRRSSYRPLMRPNAAPVPPPLPPASTSLTVTSFSSAAPTKRVSSTPDLLDTIDSGGSIDSGSMFASSGSLQTVEIAGGGGDGDGIAGVEGSTLPRFRPPLVSSRSDEINSSNHLTPPRMVGGSSVNSSSSSSSSFQSLAMCFQSL